MAKKAVYSDLKVLNKSVLKQVYVFTGPDEYFRDSSIKIVSSRIKKEVDEEVSIHKLYGEELTPEELGVNLSSMSLFSTNKLVIIKNCGKMNKDSWDIIVEFIKDPTEGATLLLEDEKIDGRTGYARTLSEHSVWYDFRDMRQNEMIEWINRQAEIKELSIDREAAVLLMNSIEKGLNNIIREFEKIELFVGQDRRVTAELVQNISCSLGSFVIFDFIDNICEGEMEYTISQLKKIFVYQESVPGLIVMMTRHLLILFKIKLYSEKMNDKNEISKKAGIVNWFYDKYARQAGNFSVAELEELLEAALEADKNLKTGFQKDKMVLTLLVHRFISIVRKDAA
ncbi:MAG: DNA polymerase III subunit delta [bacterium]|nr:DNA polymerase III subunit delta [bacterium]